MLNLLLWQSVFLVVLILFFNAFTDVKILGFNEEVYAGDWKDEDHVAHEGPSPVHSQCHDNSSEAITQKKTDRCRSNVVGHPSCLLVSGCENINPNRQVNSKEYLTSTRKKPRKNLQPELFCKRKQCQRTALDYQRTHDNCFRWKIREQW